MLLMLIRRWLARLLLIATTAVIVASCARGPGPGPGPDILPPPDLRKAADRLTPLRMQALSDNPQLCRIVLQEAGIGHSILPPRTTPEGCGYTTAVRLVPPAGAPRWSPDGLATACPVASALVMWERDILIPAAQRHFGERVAQVRHFGAYSCRGINGRPSGGLSEHARANAVDIAGFRLASGREISLVLHWHGNAAERAFLREIRDGACRHFSTVLSPDYNAAHADHFHFDQARRGASGFCR